MPSRLPLYSFMLFAILMAFVALALIITLTPARPAEMSYCKVYAARSSAEALRRLIGIPFIDTSAGRFLWRKASSRVLASSTPPT